VGKRDVDGIFALKFANRTELVFYDMKRRSKQFFEADAEKTPHFESFLKFNVAPHIIPLEVPCCSPNAHYY
jgi:hypothetical protein